MSGITHTDPAANKNEAVLEKAFEKKLAKGYRENCQLVGNKTGKCINRVMIGVPMTGLIRSEWALARYGQVIPCNWSQVESLQWLDQYSPIDFLVADARNVVCDNVLSKGFEWLFFIDHDVILPPHTVLQLNERMLKGDIPVWSGLYFTKSKPAEPLVYRGRGNGYFTDWELGKNVWVDAVPMGCTMIHRSILEELAKISDDYSPSQGMPPIKKIFNTPAKVWFDPEARTWFTVSGTEDMAWCDKIMDNGIMAKAGWEEHVEKHADFPFMVDTSIFCRHIDFSGVQYPSRGEEQEFVKGG